MTSAMKQFDDIVKDYPLLIGKVLLLRLSPTSAHLPFMCLQRGMVLDLSTSHAYSSLSDWLDALDKARHNTSHCRQEPLSTIALNATHEATLATLRQAVDQKGKKGCHLAKRKSLTMFCWDGLGLT